MKNKVYYGEYSLKHWIDLILKENIMLPWYQRSFVWEKAQVENLMKTFDNDQFVPSIIIGAVKKDDDWKNYILDGQQRLTSILFAKCNKYIDKKEFSALRPNTHITQTADDVTDDEDNIVDEESAGLFRGNIDSETNIFADHFTIIEPKKYDDLSYEIFKRFIFDLD